MFQAACRGYLARHAFKKRKVRLLHIMVTIMVHHCSLIFTAGKKYCNGWLKELFSNLSNTVFCGGCNKFNNKERLSNIHARATVFDLGMRLNNQLFFTRITFPTFNSLPGTAYLFVGLSKISVKILRAWSQQLWDNFFWDALERFLLFPGGFWSFYCWPPHWAYALVWHTIWASDQSSLLISCQSAKAKQAWMNEHRAVSLLYLSTGIPPP